MRFDHTFVIGAGGTGGHLIPALARLIAYHDAADATMTVYDGDAFEDSNTTRQLVGPDQIGQNKATAMKAYCASQGLEITAKPRYASAVSMEQAFSKAVSPLIVLTVDNDATRKAALDVTDQLSGDWFLITPGNADNANGDAPIRGQVLWCGRVQGQALGLDPRLVSPGIARPTEGIPHAGSCALNAPSAPQLITANVLAASLTLAVIQNLLDLSLPADASACYFNARNSFKLTFS